MEWVTYSTKKWVYNWKEDKIINTYVTEETVNNLRFFIFERYNRKGDLKDYIVYCKDSKSLKVGNNFAYRIKGSFISYRAAMVKCDEIITLLLNNESIDNYIVGSEYIDDECPAGDDKFGF